MNNANRNSTRLIRNVAYGTLIATICAVCSCARSVPEETTTQDARVVGTFVPSSVANVEVRSFPVFVKEGAAVKLAFRTPGKLEEFNAVVGKRFAKDEVVARLETRDYQLIVDRAQQALVEARAGLKAMETGARNEDEAALEASVVAAKSQRESAEKQFKRMESLRADGAASEVQYDAAKTAFDVAKSAELAAEKALEKGRKGSRDEEIEMVKAKIAGLEIDLQLAQNKLNDAVLKAPFDGVVSEKYVDNFETISAGVAVLTLVDDSSFEGELSVSEDFVARQKDVQKVECVFEALPDKVFSATIRQTSNSVQKGNRAYLATLAIDAKPEDGVLIGMVGVANVVFKDANPYVTVPVSSLIAGRDDSTSESAVWIVNADGTSIERRAVKVGALVDGKAQILDGLKSGETIVAAGAGFLTDGQKIRVQQDE